MGIHYLEKSSPPTSDFSVLEGLMYKGDHNVEDINRLIVDKNSYHRRRAVRLIDELGCYIPSVQQIESGLTDNVNVVREAWAKSKSYLPSEFQIRRGLNDPSIHVVLAWIRRYDIEYDRDTIESGLINSKDDIRLAWSERINWISTHSQVERGL